jgi:hypothetical protein
MGSCNVNQVAVGGESKRVSLGLVAGDGDVLFVNNPVLVIRESEFERTSQADSLYAAN